MTDSLRYPTIDPHSPHCPECSAPLVPSRIRFKPQGTTGLGASGYHCVFCGIYWQAAAGSEPSPPIIPAP